MLQRRILYQSSPCDFHSIKFRSEISLHIVSKSDTRHYLRNVQSSELLLKTEHQSAFGHKLISFSLSLEQKKFVSEK
uniref:Ovule protein n=1 Tax=Parascaris univalens TaxID=6257 RepID=A0A915ATA0_PARUN